MIVLLSALARWNSCLSFNEALRFSFGKKRCHGINGGGVSPAIGQWFDFDFSPAISVKVNTIRYTWKMGPWKPS